MLLSYEDLLSPVPIKLTIGTVKKHTLRQIAEEITFEAFNLYKLFLKITPQEYYSTFKSNDSKEMWEKLTAEEKKNATMFDVLFIDENIRNQYISILNFFFEETVIFSKEGFIFLSKDYEQTEEMKPEHLVGVVNADNFEGVMKILQQVCAIYSEPKEEEQPKYKNKLAQKLMKRMEKAQAEKSKREGNDKNMTFGNIISSVSNRSFSINPINVWDMTVFQLIDSFKKQQNNEMYNINARGVSVWGDEKNTFNSELWYKNIYE